MKTTLKVARCRKKRLLFIAAGTALIAGFSLLVLYTLFIVYPPAMIAAGLVAPGPLKGIVLLCVVIPLVFFLTRFPVVGDPFFASIGGGKAAARDIRAAIELDAGLCNPPRTDGSGADWLAGAFSERIAGTIDETNSIRGYLLPRKRRLALPAAVLLLALACTLLRLAFLADIVAALRTGLPAELISVGPVIEFGELKARVLPPAYLESDTVSVKDLLQTDTLRVMAGSRVTVRGIYPGLLGGRLFLATEKGLEFFPLVLQQQAGVFEVTFLMPARGAFALECAKPGAGGETATGKSRVWYIDAIPDHPPVIEIQAPESGFSVAFGASFPVVFTATDDYGILEITLNHRRRGTGGAWQREVIARFPREAKRSYASTYPWNPVLRDGESGYELLYPPGTRAVEYFLEVQDTNTFSGGGIGRSDVRVVNLTDPARQFQKLADVVRELIERGKELLKDQEDAKLKGSYKERLDRALGFFSNEFREIMPRSNIVQQTQAMSQLLGNKQAPFGEELREYVAYLERFLIMLDLVSRARQNEMDMSGIDQAMRSMRGGKPQEGLDRMTSLADTLGMDYRKELDEIRELLARGENEKAAQKMEELAQKMRRDLADRFKSQKGRLMKMAQEAMAELKTMMEEAKQALQEERGIATATGAGRLQQAAESQRGNNETLEQVMARAKKLEERYPFIMNSLRAYADIAERMGRHSLDQLERGNRDGALAGEGQVIGYLEELLKQGEQQQQSIKRLMEGNFESLMPFMQQDAVVFIPKEALYTVPVDYKEKIIEMSKKRGSLTGEKEGYWREVLE